MMEERQRLEPPPYIHIESNEFSYRKHKKQKEEDIAICECQYIATDPESACAEGCLNALTSTECTPGYCRCGEYCKNQRFQKCEYAKSRLVKTDDRGWGLLADEDIKAGQFVIEYCGEVISGKEAKRRSHAYEAQGLTDAYIIYLNADESIDATRKGSLARFINHSCQPNCETRKWTVLGEVRVGIFAKQDIPIGTELSYDYNFEWYGGAMVRCLCGAASCSGFLGAKSRGFQEATYLWEDDDDRFSVENVPLYDSADDEPTSISKAIILAKDSAATQEGNDNIFRNNMNLGATDSPELVPITVEPLNCVPMEVDFVKHNAAGYSSLYAHEVQRNFTLKSTNIQNDGALQNSRAEPAPLKRSPQFPGGKTKNAARKQLNVPDICDRLASVEAREEILYCEEAKKQAAAEIDVLYDEIRPAIEEHERDSQDSVATRLAEKWIEASCCKYRAEFDFYSAIIKNIACTPRRAKEDATAQEEGSLNYLENGL